MNKSNKFTVLVIDRPLVEGGRIHSKEVVENAILNAQDSINKNRFFVTGRSDSISNRGCIELNDIIGIVTKLEIDSDLVNATIKFLDTPAYKTFSETLKYLPNINIQTLFTMIGLGKVQESYSKDEPDTICDGYEMLGISVSPIRSDFGGL
jgi:uncharacterized protein (DUF1015 family)